MIGVFSAVLFSLVNFRRSAATLFFRTISRNKVADFTNFLFYFPYNLVSPQVFQIFVVDEGAILDGNGPRYWKGNNEEVIERPKFLKLNLRDSTVRYLYLLNCPYSCITLTNSENVKISDVIIDNSEGDRVRVKDSNYAKNTDGFIVLDSTHIYASDSIILNQDDCVSVKNGSHMVFKYFQCKGSHGFGISVESGNAHDIVFAAMSVDNAPSVINIKTYNRGLAGSIKNVVFDVINFSGINNNAILIQQNYPSGEATKSIPITNMTFLGVQGYMTGENSVPIYVVCAEGACADWHWRKINIFNGVKNNVCQNVPYEIKC